MNISFTPVATYYECLVIERVDCPLVHRCLSLGVLAVVREEVGLHVGIRVSITVSRR